MVLETFLLIYKVCIKGKHNIFLSFCSTFDIEVFLTLKLFLYLFLMSLINSSLFLQVQLFLIVLSFFLSINFRKTYLTTSGFILSFIFFTYLTYTVYFLSFFLSFYTLSTCTSFLHVTCQSFFRTFRKELPVLFSLSFFPDHHSNESYRSICVSLTVSTKTH